MSGKPEPTPMKGHMHKKGEKRRNWLMRFFTLENGALCYYEKQDAKSPKGFILTKDIIEVRGKTSEKIGSKSGKGDFVFEVVTKARTYYFAPEEQKAKDDWMAAIKSWIGYNEDVSTKEQPKPGDSKRASQQTTPVDPKPADGAAATSTASASATTTATPTETATPATTTAPAASTESAAAAPSATPAATPASESPAAQAPIDVVVAAAAATAEPVASDAGAAAAPPAAVAPAATTAAGATPAADVPAEAAAAATTTTTATTSGAASTSSGDAPKSGGGEAEAEHHDAKAEEEENKIVKYESQYDYDAQEDNELSFKEGDVVTVLDTFKGAGWWKAELNGKIGLIPGNFFVVHQPK